MPGKSTLLNTLLGRERAIVTDIPGTTRDLIEENVKVGQILLRVTDTAGLRNTDDPVEQAGIDRAMAEASASSLILAVFDGSKPISDEDMLVLARSAGHRAIAVVNKVDLPQQLDEKLLKKHFLHIVPLSAKTGDGLDKLLNLIPRTVCLGDGAFDGALITNARQAAALRVLPNAVKQQLYAAQSGMTPDAVVMGRRGRDYRTGRDHRRNRDRCRCHPHFQRLLRRKVMLLQLLLREIALKIQRGRLQSVQTSSFILR